MSQDFDEDAMRTPVDSPSVSVVIPTLNEAQNLPWVLEHIPEWVAEVVLVDGLSTDETELVAVGRHEDVVVVHQRVKGKGAALRAGFAAASGDIIVMIDADGSTDPREIGRFVRRLRDGADFVKGSRYLQQGGSADFSWLRSLGNRALTIVTNILFSVSFTDLCYGYCAFWKQDLERLALTADGFEIESQLVLSAINAELTVAEVPSYERMRHSGVSNLNAWRDGKRVLRQIFRERFRPATPARHRDAHLTLEQMLAPAQGSRHWRPAGLERRDHGRDRRAADPSPYDGPERRQGPRRETILETRIVHRVRSAEPLQGDEVDEAPASDGRDSYRESVVK